MLLDQNKFIVKSIITKSLTSEKKHYEILDGDGKMTLASTVETTPFFAKLFGSIIIEVRERSDNALVFTLSRTGFLFKKDQLLDAQGQMVGRYKAKMLSLSGGFNVYDKDNKHLCEIKGAMLKLEYKFWTPDGKTEMGSVSRTWGGLAKSLLSGTGTYGVTIEPAFAGDKTMKMLILGAGIAAEALFQKPKSTSGGSSSGGGSNGGGGEE